MRRSSLLLPVLFLLGACATPHMSVTPQYGTFDVKGDFGISSSGVGATADLETMGIDRDDGIIGGRFDFKWGLPHLSVSTQSSSHGGSGSLTAGIDQDGVSFSQGADVDTEFDLDLHNATLTFDVAPTDMVEVGLGIGVTAMGLDLAITEEISGETIDADELVPIPTPAVRVAVQLSRFEIAALASGLALSLGDDEVSFFDVDLYGRYKLFGGSDHVRGSILLGYRAVSFDLEYEDGSDNAEVNLDMSGPYFGLQFTL